MVQNCLFNFRENTIKNTLKDPKNHFQGCCWLFITFIYPNDASCKVGDFLKICHQTQFL